MRVRCNDCMSIFDENYIETDLISEEESCPICGRIGCLLDVEMETENYKKFKNVLTYHIGIPSLVDFDNKTSDELVILVRNIVNTLKTNKKCPHCDAILYCSDLPEYDYVCIECEENFYECEVK